MMGYKALTALAAMVATICSCCKPVIERSYVTLNRLHGWNTNAPITLAFEMTDTSNAHEIFLAGEIATQRTLEKKRGYPIILTFTAPNGNRYTDSLLLPLHVIENGKTGKTSHGIREIQWPYRRNIYCKISGVWNVTITQGDSNEDYSNIIGLGIYCKLQNK